MSTKGAISNFIEKYYLHFNAAALVDAAKGYEDQLNSGAKMLVSLAGAMSTAELGKIFAEMIRKDKVQIISCTGGYYEFGRSLPLRKSSKLQRFNPSGGMGFVGKRP